MQQINLHQQKLYALILAGIAFISLLFNWSTAKGGFGGAGENGFHSWGLLSLIGILGVIAATLMGDKTKGYEGQTKQIGLIAFAFVALGAIMWLMRIMTGSASQMGFRIKYSDIVSPGIGLFLCLIAGLAGLAWVAGLIKLNPPTAKPPTPPTPPQS